MSLNDKYELEKLYKYMSLAEIADHFGVSKSTIQYRMKKFGIERRSKQKAQNLFLKNKPHQRQNKNHSNEGKMNISEGSQKFWDSDSGVNQKNHLKERRQNEWKSTTEEKRTEIINRLSASEMPTNSLSKLGYKLADFLRTKFLLRTQINLTNDHVSDIILDERKIVIEITIPFDVFGSNKLSNRYKKLISRLNELGYKVLIIQDNSSSISHARCRRTYKQILDFIESGENARLI